MRGFTDSSGFGALRSRWIDADPGGRGVECPRYDCGLSRRAGLGRAGRPRSIGTSLVRAGAPALHFASTWWPGMGLCDGLWAELSPTATG